MKFTDAFWEKRNLGVDTLEVQTEEIDFRRDSFEFEQQILRYQQSKGYGYVVIKLPEGHPELDRYLQQCKWWKVETQIELVANAKNVEFCTARCKDVLENISLEVIREQNQLDFLKHEIEKGIFQTDRIALDPSYGVAIAGKRYANWVQDEFDRGSHISFGCVDGKRVEFALDRYTGRAREGLLGGLLLDTQYEGGAGLLEAFRLRKDLENGIKRFHTYVSSNNLVILRLHESMGYRVKSLQGVYIRHF